MTILSPRILALLSDENVRKAVDEILKNPKASDSKTVTTTSTGTDNAVPSATTVTVRRVA